MDRLKRLPLPQAIVFGALFILLLALSAGHSWAQENGWPTPTYDESSATEAKEQLGDILSRPAYQWETDPVNVEPSLWERIRDRLLEILFNLLPESAGAAMGSSISWPSWGPLSSPWSWLLWPAPFCATWLPTAPLLVKWMMRQPFLPPTPTSRRNSFRQ